FTYRYIKGNGGVENACSVQVNPKSMLVSEFGDSRCVFRSQNSATTAIVGIL
ncbi:unnamed protein product, partial [marine sediment metagenome]